MELTGTIIHIGETQYIGDKGFSKRLCVINYTDNNYTYPIAFEFLKDRGDILDRYKVGDEVEIAFNIKGREFTKNGTTSYFNTLEGWKINKIAGAPVQEQPQAQVVLEEDETGDLPF
jgi:single-strand DNA-binding protein